MKESMYISDTKTLVSLSSHLLGWSRHNWSVIPGSVGASSGSSDFPREKNVLYKAKFRRARGIIRGL